MANTVLIYMLLMYKVTQGLGFEDIVMLKADGSPYPLYI